MKGELMKTYIAYFDETGDDGVTINSSDHFILTSLYMPAAVSYTHLTLPTSDLV